jgi:hypothetical protein
MNTNRRTFLMGAAAAAGAGLVGGEFGVPQTLAAQAQ